MRILMVTEDIPAPQVGGLGKHVVTLANALIAAGHQVDLMGRNDRDYASSAGEVGFNGRFIAGFSLAKAGWKETQLGVFIAPKRPALAQRIARAIIARADGYDVVHYHGHLPMVGRYIPDSINFVQTRHDQGSECLAHVRFAGGKVCDTTLSADCARCMHTDPGPIRRLVSAAAVDRYRRETAEAFARHNTIFVSDFLKRQFSRAIPDSELGKAHVIHNFIDFARLRRLAPTAGDIERGTVLLAGRIDQAKGFGAFLAEAAGRIPQGVVLNIVGDGPDKRELEREYAHPQIIFHGWQPYDEVVRMTSRSNVCVVPSIWQEPFGTTILEALALGRPCIALARGGSPEMMRYQRYPGQLVLVDDMQALVSEAVSRALQETPPMPMPESMEADVNVALRPILDVYFGQ
jgi:glycosyltransferase involved in cell wall biosynthesis